MAYFDVAAFVSKLDRMGVKLTVIPLADGKVRINRWNFLAAAEHMARIGDLWAAEIGENQARIDLLAAHLSRGVPDPARIVATSKRTEPAPREVGRTVVERRKHPYRTEPMTGAR